MYKRFPNKGFAVGHAKKTAEKVSEAAYVIGSDADDVAKEGGGTEYLAVLIIEQYADKLSEADRQIFADAGVFVREQPTPEDIKERAKMETQQEQAAETAPVAQDVQRFDGQTVSVEVPKGHGRRALVSRNGVSRPAAASMANAIWDAADRLSGELKRPVTGGELRAEMFPKGFSSSIVSQNYAKWRTFWDVSDEAITAIEAELDAPKRAALEEAAAEEQRLKDEAKQIRKEARALETLAKKEQRKQERAEVKAAKARSKEEGRAVKDAQRSEESQRKLEEKLAKSSAIMQERMAEQQRVFAERQAKREARLAARAEEYRLRNEKAKAALEEARARVAAMGSAPTQADAAPTQEEADTTEGARAEAAS